MRRLSRLGYWIGASIIIGVCFGVIAFESIHVFESPERIVVPHVSSASMKMNEMNVDPPVIHHRLSNPGIVEASFRASYDWEVKQGARILLVPHHLIAGREIASLLKAVTPPKKAIILAPDHFSQGRTSFTTTDAVFLTDAGRVETDGFDIRSLALTLPSVRVDERPFTNEPGLPSLLPMIRTAWPETNVIPLIVRHRSSKMEREALAEELTRWLRDDPSILLVSTVDFSHYLPAEVADFHDMLARDVIEGLGVGEAFEVECDSPDTLSITLDIARRLELGTVDIHSHTNSLVLAQSKMATESTSHVVASFSPGTPRTQDTITMLFVGDMMFDRGVRTRMEASSQSAFPFDEIRGKEGRFFQGQDLIIGNLEGPITASRLPPEKENDFAFDPDIAKLLADVGFDAVSQANNHTLDQGRFGAEESIQMLTAHELVPFGDQVRDDATSSLSIIERRGRRVALIGFNDTDNRIDLIDAERTFEEAKRQADSVVVFVHWGSEYQARPNVRQKELATWCIDHGADAVIGSHPHWVQGIAEYKGRPIVYSLGNFVFDQDWSQKTQEGLVVGLALAPATTTLALFPIRIDKSRPFLLTGEERAAQLLEIAAISEDLPPGSLTKGVLHFSQ